MLSRLRHHGFVGCNDQHHQIDSANAGEHVFDEPLMTGNINEAYRCRRIQREVSESEVNRDAPLFFFF